MGRKRGNRLVDRSGSTAALRRQRHARHCCALRRQPGISVGCHHLAIAHPTGYPLYTLLGGLWSRVLFPFGKRAWRMNIFARAGRCGNDRATLSAGKTADRREPLGWAGRGPGLCLWPGLVGADNRGRGLRPAQPPGCGTSLHRRFSGQAPYHSANSVDLRSGQSVLDSPSHRGVSAARSGPLPSMDTTHPTPSPTPLASQGDSVSSPPAALSLHSHAGCHGHRPIWRVIMSTVGLVSGGMCWQAATRDSSATIPWPLPAPLRIGWPW